MKALVGPVLTYHLRNGSEVLAKMQASRNFPQPYLSPVQYANRTQANARVATMGPGWAVAKFTGPSFYVVRVAA